MQQEDSTRMDICFHRRGILHSYPSHRKLKCSVSRKINSFSFSFFTWKMCCTKQQQISSFHENSEQFPLYHRILPSHKHSYLPKLMGSIDSKEILASNFKCKRREKLEQQKQDIVILLITRKKKGS